MPLLDYIRIYYDGNQSAFAAAIGKPRQRVSEWVKAGNWYVYDGMILQEKMTLQNPR